MGGNEQVNNSQSTWVDNSQSTSQVDNSQSTQIDNSQSTLLLLGFLCSGI